MGHALSMRATSLGASGLLLGLATLVALTASIEIGRNAEIPEGVAIPFITEAPTPPPPTPEPNERQPDTTTIIDLPFTTPPLVQTIEGPATPTEVLVAYPEPATITDAHWLRRPSDLSRYYPRRALERGVEGQAILNCLVSTTGALSCTVASETPAGWEFGEAALRISRDHQMQPANRGGENVVGRYRMVVPFALN
jgi:periplasmic protein TonB